MYRASHDKSTVHSETFYHVYHASDLEKPANEILNNDDVDVADRNAWRSRAQGYSPSRDMPEVKRLAISKLEGLHKILCEQINVCKRQGESMAQMIEEAYRIISSCGLRFHDITDLGYILFAQFGDGFISRRLKHIFGSVLEGNLMLPLFTRDGVLQFECVIEKVDFLIEHLGEGSNVWELQKKILFGNAFGIGAAVFLVSKVEGVFAGCFEPCVAIGQNYLVPMKEKLHMAIRSLEDAKLELPEVKLIMGVAAAV